MKKILVIAPHADDEVLGCGATMAKACANGDEVYVLICTNASVGAPELFSEDIIKQIRKEAVTAHKLIGIMETFFLEFPAPVLDQYPRYKMSNEISAINVGGLYRFKYQVGDRVCENQWEERYLEG